MIRANVINEVEHRAALDTYRKSIEWNSWAGRWCTSFGAVFLLAGVIFFFAWNWKEMSPLVRFAVLEGGVVVATTAALVVGLHRGGGQWLLTAAAVITGVLTAVYGQVYQTGADAFEVFALWTVLIFGWVLVSKFAPLWLVWLAVLQTALATFAGQVLIPAEVITWLTAHFVLGLVSAGCVVLREWLEDRQSAGWLRGEWLRVILVLTTLLWLSAIPFELIFDSFNPYNESVLLPGSVGVVVWLAAVAGGASYYTLIKPSLTSVGLCLLSAAIILVSWCAEMLLNGAWDSKGAWLLIGVLAILIFSGSAAVIARAARIISDRKSSTEDSTLAV